MLKALGYRRGAYSVLVGEPKGKRSLGRHTRGEEDNIKINLQEVVWGAWTGSGHGQVAE
jgi:hypothetical protein